MTQGKYVELSVAVLPKKLKRVHQGVRGYLLSASSALELRLLGAL